MLQHGNIMWVKEFFLRDQTKGVVMRIKRERVPWQNMEQMLGKVKRKVYVKQKIKEFIEKVVVLW